jgi:hypothetical protein
MQARAEHQRAGTCRFGVQGRGGQIQCEVVREAWTHSGRLQHIGSQAADGKVYVGFVFIVYKAFFTLSHMRASFRSMKTAGNFLFAGSLNNYLNYKRYKLTV